MDEQLPTTRALTPLSAAIAEPLEKLFRVGGLQLVAIFIGTVLLTISGFIETSSVAHYAILSIGVGFMLLTLILYYLTYISPVSAARAELRSKAAFIDDLQVATVEIAATAERLHDSVYANANIISQAINQSGPLLAKVPGFGEKLSAYVTRARDLSADIVYYSGRAKDITSEIGGAVRAADVGKLRNYVDQLVVLRTELSQGRDRSAGEPLPLRRP